MSAEILMFPRRQLTPDQLREQKALEIMNHIRTLSRPVVLKVERRQARRRFFRKLLAWRPW